MDQVPLLQSLVGAYARALDRRDAATLQELFVPNGRLAVHSWTLHGAPSRVLIGRVEIASAVSNLAAAYAKTFHFVGNSTYEVDGESATGEVSCIAHHLVVEPERTYSLAMCITYHDQYACTEHADWQFTDRRVLIEWSETRPATTGELPEGAPRTDAPRRRPRPPFGPI
jgi:hypothetical protein